MGNQDRELLLSNLEQIDKKQRKQFCYYLRGERPRIPGSLTHRDTTDIAEKMMETFNDATKVALQILQKIPRNDLAKELEEKIKTESNKEKSQSQVKSSSVAMGPKDQTVESPQPENTDKTLTGSSACYPAQVYKSSQPLQSFDGCLACRTNTNNKRGNNKKKERKNKKRLMEGMTNSAMPQRPFKKIKGHFGETQPKNACGIFTLFFILKVLDVLVFNSLKNYYAIRQTWG
ncbi:uncharacterized protein LOC143099203 isoform X2 [Alosa pseudoharengus]|uniref:uncharacterized protein LOC143099203 isoform X2 n=1 Tax=Alosa pseudoharengus TaxID=34774 RepID=UPI003F8977DB